MPAHHVPGMRGWVRKQVLRSVARVIEWTTKLPGRGMNVSRVNEWLWVGGSVSRAQYRELAEHLSNDNPRNFERLERQADAVIGTHAGPGLLGVTAGASANRFAPWAHRCQELLDKTARGEEVPRSGSS